MKRVRVIHQHVAAPQPSPAAGADEPTPILKGIKVVELATVIAAPSAAAVLADFGAEVTKIEAPGGDMWRAFGPNFGNENRGKKSVVIDIKDPEQLAVLKAMLADSDVFVTNVRSAPLQRVGLDYGTIRKEMPKLIYAQLSAWGQTGPMSVRCHPPPLARCSLRLLSAVRSADPPPLALPSQENPGYDAGAYWAASGLQDYMRPDEDSEPPRFPGGIGDHTASMQLFGGIALALFHRQNTGEGTLVDANLLKAGLWGMGVPLMTKLGSEAMMEAGPDSHVPTVNARLQAGVNPTFNNYKTSDDRWIQMLGLETPRHWPKLVESLGLKDQVPETWFTATREQRTAAPDTLALFDATFATKTLNEWKAIFDANDVWYQPILRIQEVAFDPQVLAIDGFTPVIENGDGTKHAVIGSPIQLSAVGVTLPTKGAPSLGADTEAAFAKYGLK